MRVTARGRSAAPAGQRFLALVGAPALGLLFLVTWFFGPLCPWLGSVQVDMVRWITEPDKMLRGLTARLKKRAMDAMHEAEEQVEHAVHKAGALVTLIDGARSTPLRGPPPHPARGTPTPLRWAAAGLAHHLQKLMESLNELLTNLNEGDEGGGFSTEAGPIFRQMVVFIQIVVSFGSTLTVPWPSFFTKFTSALKFVMARERSRLAAAHPAATTAPSPRPRPRRRWTFSRCPAPAACSPT